MKVLKWIVGVFAVVVIGLGIYIKLAFNPNDYKPEIIRLVKEKTGRDLILQKEFSLSIFPSLGVNLGSVTLSNPEGFKQGDMLNIHEAAVEIAFMPLLSKKVDVSLLKLDGVTMNLITQKDGKSSLDGLLDAADDHQNSDSSDENETSPLNGFSVGGVAITNTKINVLDEAKNTQQQLLIEKFTLDRLTLGEFSTLDFKFKVMTPGLSVASEGGGKLNVSEDLQSIQVRTLKINHLLEGEAIPNKKMQVSMAGEADVLMNKQSLVLRLDSFSADQLHAKGNISLDYGAATPKLDVKMDWDDLDIDALFPQLSASEQAASTDKIASEGSQSEPDLRALKGVNADVLMTAKSIKVANTHSQDWQFAATLRNAVLNANKISAKMYDGTLFATAKLDMRNRIARYQFTEKVKAVQVKALLKDVAETDIVSGTANITTSGSGAGLLMPNIKKNLLAKGQFSIENGALYGVNIPYKIRKASALWHGEDIPQEEEKTDFTQLSGSFSTASGILKNPDLKMISPYIALSGAGKLNMLTDALNYRLSASLEGSNTESAALSGVAIPVTITGTLQSPSYNLDFDALVGDKVNKKVEEIKEKAKEDITKKVEEEIQDKLKDKLFKKLRF